MKALKKVLITLTGITVLLGGAQALAPASVLPAAQASNKTEVNQAINDSGGTGGLSVPQLVKNVINILSWIVGIVSVIMLVIGGFMYITSSGESGKIQNAKNTILYALVGLVIAIFAQAIVTYVIGQSTK